MYVAAFACASALHIQLPSLADRESYSLEEFMDAHNLAFSGGVVEVNQSAHAHGESHLHAHAWALAETVGASVVDTASGRTGGDTSVKRTSRALVENTVVSQTSILRAMHTGALKMHSGTVTVTLKPHEWNGTFGIWNGRTGNNILQLGAALVFARHVGATKLKIDKPENFQGNWLFSIPPEFTLPSPSNAHLLQNCAPVDKALAEGRAMNFWVFKCALVPASMYHAELMTHIRPLMTKRLSQCVEAAEEPHERKQLTVHLRVGGLHDYTDNNTPCNAFETMYREGNYTRLQVVKTVQPEHPCLLKLAHVARPHLSDKPLLDDLCSLMRARSLYVSFSTFPEAALLLSDRIQEVYHSTGTWEHHLDEKGVSWCTDNAGRLWPGGPRLIEYEYPGYTKAMIHTYPAERIVHGERRKCPDMNVPS